MSTEYFRVTVSDKTLGGEAYARSEGLEVWKEVSFKALDGQDVFLSCDLVHTKQIVLHSCEVCAGAKDNAAVDNATKIGWKW